jgi:hypothetical protein
MDHHRGMSCTRGMTADLASRNASYFLDPGVKTDAWRSRTCPSAGGFLPKPPSADSGTRGTSSTCEFVSVKLLFLTNALPERTNIVLIDINGTPLPIVLGEFEDYGMNEVSQTGEGIRHGLLQTSGYSPPYARERAPSPLQLRPSSCCMATLWSIILIDMMMSQHQFSKETTNPSSLSRFCALLPSRENFASRSSGLGLPFRTLLETNLCIIRNGRRGT